MRSFTILFALAGGLIVSGCQKQGGDSATKPTNAMDSSYTISRIYFKLPEIHELPTTNEVLKLLADHKKNDAVHVAFEKLRKAASITDYTKGDLKHATNETRLASVNGKTLTRADSSQLVDLHVKLSKLRSRRMGDSATKRLRKKLQKTAVPHFVQCELWGEYARQHSLTLNPTQVLSNQTAFAKAYGAKTYDNLLTKLSLFERQLLAREMERTLLMDVAKKDVLSRTNLVSTPEEVSSTLVRFQHIREISLATNALIWAQASNVWTRIKKNELTFAEAAADLTQTDSDERDGTWGTFTLQDLKEEPMLQSFLCTARKNDISEPIEADNGLCLFKVVRIESAKTKTRAPSP